MSFEVVNKRTHTPTKMDFYIGRPGNLGNPYSHLHNTTMAAYRVGTRDEAVDAYERWFEYNKRFVDVELNKIRELHKTFGHVNLVCWCFPERCHGSVIKKFLEEELNNEK